MPGRQIQITAKKIIIKKEGGKMAKTNKRKSSGSAIVMEKKIPFWKFVLHHKGLYLMLLPGLLYFIIFRYIPMAGIIIAHSRVFLEASS